MLIRFSLENWMSFRDQTELSMVATREQQHGERVSKIKRVQMRVLPVSMMFGGNASGKTNFFRAISFSKFMVTSGNHLNPTASIPAEPFLLDLDSRGKPCRFVFTILVDDDIYEYSFSVTRARVLAESLKRITAPAKDFSFSREWDGRHGKEVFKFGKAFQADLDFMNLAARATRPNQLFLNGAVLNNILPLRPVFDWFSDTLKLISPIAEYGNLERYADASEPAFARISELLSDLDTGIRQLRRKEIPIESLPFDKAEIEDISRDIKPGETIRVRMSGKTWPYLLTRFDNGVKAEKLVACHLSRTGGGDPVEFEIDHESDGTKRIFDLLPAFVDLEAQSKPKVYVIDEIDRCLHTQATQELLRIFLDSISGNSRSQLLATTHDTGLMTQSIFRRDEIRFAERDDEDVSRLYSVSDFADSRRDTDLLHSYLSGRMGGIPRIVVRKESR